MRRIPYLLLLSSLLGCTYVNTSLNDERIPLEHRIQNHTRCTTGGEAVPIPARANSLSSSSAVRPVAKVAPDSPTTHPTNPAEMDDYFVGVAISGGGSRSANFSAACMFQLQRLNILDKVDYISSVSGGSLTAAYFCLYDKDWNPATVQNRLTHSFATDVLLDTLMPWNWFALAFTDKDRSDFLASSFDRNLFSRNGRTLTFKDLRRDRPRLLINSTDLQSGRRFVFSNEEFDQLNSSLDEYPIAYAVAASAAVPVLMHQVTLRNFDTTFKQYRHLIDGGINDNLGIQSLVDTYEAQIRPYAARKDKSLPYPGGAVLILIDARTNFDAKLSDKGDTSFIESLKAGAGLTSTALLNRTSTATLAEMILQYAPPDAPADKLRAQIKQLEEEGYVEIHDRYGRPVRILHLSLPRVNDLSNVPFQSFRESVNSIATYFNIDSAEAYNLYQAADLLIKEKFEPTLREIALKLAQPATPSTRP